MTRKLEIAIAAVALTVALPLGSALAAGERRSAEPQRPAATQIEVTPQYRYQYPQLAANGAAAMARSQILESAQSDGRGGGSRRPAN